MIGRRGLAAVAALLALPARAAVLAATPISRTDIPRWRARHEAALARLRAGPVRLVWLGDSITENWEKPAYQAAWNRFYGDREAINLGFSGDTTANVLWRVRNGEVDGIAPAALVLLVGANNLGRVHWSASDTLDGVAAILDELRRRLPRTHVLLLSTLPREGDAWVMRTQTEIVRGMATRFQARPEVTYIDVSRLFLRDGQIDTSLYDDPPKPALHPNPAGMTRIAEAIEAPLAAVMGDRAKAG